MQKKTIFGILGILIAVSTICFSGCIQNTDSTIHSKTLTIVFNNGPSSDNSYDPAYAWDGWKPVQYGIYETLFFFDKNMQLSPKLATGYQKISDTKFEIELRKNVTFHDGTPMNADAVIYSLERVINPENTRSSEYSFIKEIKKVNDTAILIQTTEPYPALIPSLSDPITAIVSPENQQLYSHPIGTGPYIFVSSVGGARDIYLKKNPHYWGGEVGCDNIHILVNTDGLTRVFMLKSGKADIIQDVIATEYNTILSDNYKIISTPSLRQYFLIVNTEKEPFNDIRVRQALSYAIDREEVIKTALEGVGGIRAVGIFPDVLSWNANDGLERYNYHPEKARNLFADAGITEGDDGKLMYKGKPFTIEITTYTMRSYLRETAEVIAAQLEKLGITVNIRLVDRSEPIMNKGDFQLSLYSQVTAPTGDPGYFFETYILSSSPYAQKWFHYANKNTDEMIREAKSTYDKEKRKEIYDKLQEMLQYEAFIINIFTGKESSAMKSSVTGFVEYPYEYTYITKDITIQDY